MKEKSSQLKSNTFLVDTHVFLWWLSKNKHLQKSTLEILKNPNNHIFISLVSLWEICIKHISGRLPLKTSITEMVDVSGFELLPVYFSHILEFEKLQPFHKDPFDRMLIAQAKAENLTFISSDTQIFKYKIPLFKVYV